MSLYTYEELLDRVLGVNGFGKVALLVIGGVHRAGG